MNLCTIIAKNYLAQARVLVDSFRRYHPEGRCYVLVVDGIDGFVDPAAEPFETVSPGDIGVDPETFSLMATSYDVTELSTAVKPSLLAMLLERHGEPVVYLDPDIQLFGSLEEVGELAHEHGLVLTPHFTEPPPADGKIPSEVQIVASGAYNLGFVALGPGRDADKLLRWWAKRLRHDCIVDHPLGLFVDQRWFDLAPSFVEDFHVLRDPGYNVAYWNLATRRMARAPGGTYTVNEGPLRFFHFSGYDPRRPHLLSKHQDRFSLADDPVLGELFSDYREALLARGQAEASQWPYGYDEMADGAPLTPWLRRVFRKAELAGELQRSVFTRDGVEEFYAWLSGPAETGGGFGVNRFLAEVHYARPDLRTAFPDLAVPGDADGLLRWAHVHGDEVPIPQRLLPPLAPWLGRARSLSSTSPVPLPGAAAAEPGAGAPAEPARPGLAWGVNVAGYLRSELGVAEAARQTIRALDCVGVPVMPVQGSVIPSSRQQHAYAYVAPEAAPFSVNLICVNADRLPQFLADVGREFIEGRYRIGMWWWEVSTFPEMWSGSFDLLDEVWVGTQHVADALIPVSPIPVIRVPVPISVPPPLPLSRTELGLPDGFLFLFVFDFHSVLERKNPLGLIEAFTQAFPPGAGVSLAIKCINGEHHPDERERLRTAAADHPDVHLLEHYVAAAEKNAMIASAQCYVSLHRSEGLGLTLAEAMYLGKPVIATGYSGNTDFMTEENGYLVPFSMAPIGPGNEPYPQEGEWAEPDLEEAARLMRRVMADWGAAERRGERAAHDIRRTHSAQTAGEAMKRRLELVRSRQQVASRSGAAPAAPADFQELDGLIRRGPSSPSRSRAGAVAKRGLERMQRYRSIHQRTIDERVTRWLSQLDRRSGEALAAARQGQATIGLLFAELRRQSDEIAAVRPEAERFQGELQRISSDTRQVQDWLAKSNDLLSASERIVRESQARPNPAFLPFETFTDDVAGRVYGYRSRLGTGDGDYVGFEDLFRGDEDVIRRRLEGYLDLLGGREPVLDAGCGRGELLDLLRERGIAAMGVDRDEGMVTRCRRKGHRDVEVGDLGEYLERQADGSLGAVFSAQVIEHLPLDELQRFLNLSVRKLAPDGIFIAETVNPHSAQALKAFWLDLTHQQPIFPEVALALCSSAGFGSAFVFHPNSSGDVDRDRFLVGDYAVVAAPAPLADGDAPLGGEARQAAVPG